MHPDFSKYYYFATKSRIKKSLHSIAGLIQGIAIDGVFTPGEIVFLSSWLEEHQVLRRKHPFNEIIPAIENAMADGTLSDEEREDIVWLCDRLAGEAGYLDEITPSMQRLHGLLGGIIADGEIRLKELTGLRDWLEENRHLATCWPYDEIDSLVTAVLADKRIDAAEHKLLMSFFAEFVTIEDDKTISNPLVITHIGISGLCACCPEIRFPGATFCFTGASSRHSRTEIASIVERLGASVSGGVSKKTDYLVIGSEGNPCWAYACYGRKVEAAVQLRKQGGRIMLIHENDFWDAVADG